ncbi:MULTISPECIES: hypothetical protein [unclassified Tolypothrix]|uniref:hypothetical protein n=1 Tax=unclassified Tolypothrix TaxID=2649714 RepID=UPI0005EABD3D|nr:MULTISPECIES: hypothetical protein [unclassified Tolypothrix]BAY90949.1 hypothetical protein NIES3275_29690 [Microchaete diplosiphon NIES-3275]EKE99805.1 hypothetical protein FDUTEX481_09682 [Tolypothrix sp. PCC 7601]MBE9082742.1 hypothetical protein [Tolypothrix sp. LEGE 11397]UYD25062.1 hypothetical protein HGR01_27235 [Tolypothrix sp. PCC 7712]UYD32700.1 hypothetical protein HG267_27390 [Tolypothrix sp. PCC 7601]
MEASQIANLLRAIAELVESDPQVAKAVEKCLANSLNAHKSKDSSEIKQKQPNPSKTLENGDVILAECRQILREHGEEQLRLYLTELGEKVRELLKHGQLDPNRSIRRRKDLGNIIEHIIQKLQAQDKSGKLLAASISKT